MDGRRLALWRAFLLSLCAITVLLSGAQLLDVTGAGGAPWYGLWGAVMGASTAPYTIAVHAVDPGGPSDRAGLRQGDVVDVRTNILTDRFAELWDSGQPLLGKKIQLLVTRGSQHLAVTVIPGPVNVARRWDLVVAPLGVLWLALFAALIAWRRAYVPGNLLLSCTLLLTAIATGAASHGFGAPWAWVYVLLAMSTFAGPIAVALWATFASGFAAPLSRSRLLAQWVC